MTELIVRNAMVLDGTGSPAAMADVAVDGGRIPQVATTGLADGATREIDAAGLHLAPGFIDTHAHDDGAFLRHPGMEFKLAQGVTSVVSGNCGFSAVPADPDVDSAAASAHKFHGPRGVGFLALSSKARLAPLQEGGGQEGGQKEAFGLITSIA